MDAIVRFWELAKKATDAFWSSDGNSQMEPFLVELLALIRRFPEHRIPFAEAFRRIIDRPNEYCLEVVIFCMHELRWAEVRQFAEQRRSEATDLRVKDHMQNVIDAYSPAWPGEAEWEYYSGRAS